MSLLIGRSCLGTVGDRRRCVVLGTVDGVNCLAVSEEPMKEDGTNAIVEDVADVVRVEARNAADEVKTIDVRVPGWRRYNDG